MKMRFVATAEDGCVFTSDDMQEAMKNCMLHEMQTKEQSKTIDLEALGVKMYNENGKRTNQTSDAVFVFLPDHYDIDTLINPPAKAYREKCNADDSTCVGIDDEAFGWYMWDSCIDEYHHVMPDLAEAFARCISDANHTL